MPHKSELIALLVIAVAGVACSLGISVWLCYSLITKRIKRGARAAQLILILAICCLLVWVTVRAYPAFWAEILRQGGEWQKLAEFKPVTKENIRRIAMAQILLKRPDLLFELLGKIIKKNWLNREDLERYVGLYSDIETDPRRMKELVACSVENYPETVYHVSSLAAEWAEDNNRPDLMREICGRAAAAYARGRVPASLMEALELAALLARDEQSSAALQVLEEARNRWGKSSFIDHFADTIRRGQPVRIGPKQPRGPRSKSGTRTQIGDGQ